MPTGSAEIPITWTSLDINAAGRRIANESQRVSSGKMGKTFTYCRPGRYFGRATAAPIKAATVLGGGARASSFRATAVLLRPASSFHFMETNIHHRSTRLLA